MISPLFTSSVFSFSTSPRPPSPKRRRRIPYRDPLQGSPIRDPLVVAVVPSEVDNYRRSTPFFTVFGLPEAAEEKGVGFARWAL